MIIESQWELTVVRAENADNNFDLILLNWTETGFASRQKMRPEKAVSSDSSDRVLPQKRLPFIDKRH